MQRLNETVNPVKRKLSILAKKTSIGERLLEAFGTDDKAFIAEKLGFETVQAVYKVLKGERELDFERLQKFKLYTKRSIDWLLTGVEDPSPREQINFESSIDRYLRQIVRDEIARMERTDAETGIDVFLAAAVKQSDDPAVVMRDWYRHEGWPLEQIPVPIFKDWDGLTTEEKVSELRKHRDETVRHINRHEILSPQKTKTTE